MNLRESWKGMRTILIHLYHPPTREYYDIYLELCIRHVNLNFLIVGYVTVKLLRLIYL